jgi:hypothetical protein
MAIPGCAGYRVPAEIISYAVWLYFYSACGGFAPADPAAKTTDEAHQFSRPGATVFICSTRFIAPMTNNLTLPEIRPSKLQM